MMHYNHDLILEMQQQLGAKGQPILTSAGEGPVEAIVYAHSQSSRCSILKGQLGNMWAYLCDKAERGAADPTEVTGYSGAFVSHVTPGRACHMLPRGEQSQAEPSNANQMR